MTTTESCLLPEMLPNAGTNPDNIITTILGIGNDGGDW